MVIRLGWDKWRRHYSGKVGSLGSDSVGEVNEAEVSGDKNFVITVESSKSLKSTS